MLLITQLQTSLVTLLQDQMIRVLISITVCSFFRNMFSLRTPQRKKSHGFKSRPFRGQFCPHAKRSGNRCEMIYEPIVSCRKSKTAFAVCGLIPSYMNHWVCTSKLVARRWDTKALQKMLT
jgi:hypothetical protein